MYEWKRGGFTYRAHPVGSPDGDGRAVKAVGDQWDPKDHPRDARGRFVEKYAFVKLSGGGTGTIVDFDSKSRRFLVRRDSDGHTVKVLPSHVTVAERPADKPLPADLGGEPTSEAIPEAAIPGEVAPGEFAMPAPAETPVGATPAGTATAKADLTSAQRNIINDLGFDHDQVHPLAVREAAARVRAKKPLTAEQAEALAEALRLEAASPGTPKQRARSLEDAAWRLHSVSAKLTGVQPEHIPANAVQVTPADVMAGDRVALPGRGGAADIRNVLEAKPWYGQYRITVEDGNGKREVRYLTGDTKVYRYDGPDPKTTGPKAADMAQPKTAKPKALYSGTGGPGAVGPGQNWFDVLAKSGDNSAPIPVTGLVIQGVKVDGIAFRQDGRSYFVQPKPGESDEEAVERAAAAGRMLEQVVGVIPGDTKALVRGLALVESKNPSDGHWEKTYGINGFESAATGGLGGITMWNGTAPTPIILAHEFGHNVDTGAHGLGGGKKVSESSKPILTGQTMSWEEAVKADAASSSFYADRFTETRAAGGQHTVTPGKAGVTKYGSSSPAEDFAESVRLWMKDRRENKIGFDSKSPGAATGAGTNIRFADLYPERARILDAAFGASSTFNTPAHEERQKELSDQFETELKKAPAPSAKPPAVAYRHGLPATEVDKLWVETRERQAKARAEKAAALKAKQELAKKQEAAKKAAEEQVRTAQQALELGLFDSTDAAEIHAKVAAFRKKTSKTLSGPELEQAVAAYEAEVVAKHFGLDTDFKPLLPKWRQARFSPGIHTGLKMKAHKWLMDAGSTVHPKAQKQPSQIQQAKANIVAELASRMNNESDWELFRDSYENDPDNKHGPNPKIGPFGDYTVSERQTILDEELSKRVRAWAMNSGGTHTPSVLMQQAVKDEFGLNGPPAPALTKEAFDDLMVKRYAYSGGWYRRVARVQYEHTQEELAAAGITEISVYRGMFPQGPLSPSVPDWAKNEGVGPTDMSPANSWSTYLKTAKIFSGEHGLMMSGKVPVELILGSARTGFGCYNEQEFVVMSADGDLEKEHLKG